ncbi:MAG: peptidase M64, partial [Gammaproteobacteria bacterium]
MHRFVWALLISLLSLSLYAANPQTMRVDFYHSGNNEAEIFSLDRVVLEPLAFSGNLGQPLDQTLRGKYSFEIVDPNTGDVAWSRSFSSIYGEWETTGEARKMNRTFHESLRFPR